MKKDNGSITLYVLIAMLFFIAILVGLYVSNVNYERTVKEVAEQGTNNIDDIYYDASEGDVYNPQDQVFFFEGGKRPHKGEDGNYYWENKNPNQDDLLLDGYTDDMYNEEEKCIDFDGNAKGVVGIKLNALPKGDYTVIMVIKDTTDVDQCYYSNKSSTQNGFSFVKTNNLFQAHTSKDYLETFATKDKIQIANVYNYDEGTLTTYKNNVCTGGPKAVGKELVLNNSTLRLANDFSGDKNDNAEFKCYEFLFYNRALDQKEIASIYKANQRNYGI